MSGTSVDISQFKALAAEIGISVIPSNYKEEALQYPSFCEVLAPEKASTPLYGDISTTIHFGTAPDKTPDGAPYTISAVRAAIVEL